MLALIHDEDPHDILGLVTANGADVGHHDVARHKGSFLATEGAPVMLHLVHGDEQDCHRLAHT